MKQGTYYAAKLKKAYPRFKRAVVDLTVPEPDDPVRRLCIAILGIETGETAAEKALDRALGEMVDWNEVRVSNPLELHKGLGNRWPNGARRCGQVIDALQSIYEKENTPSLDRIKTMGRRDARHYLEKLDGVDEYVAASVMLWSLGGHAIPVDDRVLAFFRREALVHPEATRAEVQAFLERNVPASRAKEFCIVMNRAANSRAPRKRPGKKIRAARAQTRARKTTKKKAPKRKK